MKIKQNTAQEKSFSIKPLDLTPRGVHTHTSNERQRHIQSIFDRKNNEASARGACSGLPHHHWKQLLFSPHTPLLFLSRFSGQRWWINNTCLKREHCSIFTSEIFNLPPFLENSPISADESLPNYDALPTTFEIRFNFFYMRIS